MVALFGMGCAVCTFFLLTLMPSDEPFRFGWTALISAASGALWAAIARGFGFGA